MFQKKADEVSFAFKHSITKYTSISIDSCAAHLGSHNEPKMYIHNFRKLTTSGDREARILLNSFFASSSSCLYIAFDNWSSFTFSGTSSPIASQSKTTISVLSLSKAISSGVFSFSSVASFASTLQKSIVFLLRKRNFQGYTHIPAKGGQSQCCH